MINTQGLAFKIPKMSVTTTNRPVDAVHYWHKEGLLHLDPPYQRGLVWGESRKQMLIKSIFTRVPIPSLVINDHMEGADYKVTVIDGKQRISSILSFMLDELALPGDWFGADRPVLFSHLSSAQQRGFRNCTIGICETDLATVEQEREVFDLINFGGVAQGDDET